MNNLFFAYGSLADKNMSKGAQVLLEYVADEVPLFFPIFLIVLWFILVVGSYKIQEKSSMKGGDFITSGTTGSIITFVLAILLSFMQIITAWYLVIIFIICVVFIVLLFTKSKD